MSTTISREFFRETSCTWIPHGSYTPCGQYAVTAYKSLIEGFPVRLCQEHLDAEGDQGLDAQPMSAHLGDARPYPSRNISRLLKQVTSPAGTAASDRPDLTADGATIRTGDGTIIATIPATHPDPEGAALALARLLAAAEALDWRTQNGEQASGRLPSTLQACSLDNGHVGALIRSATVTGTLQGVHPWRGGTVRVKTTAGTFVLPPGELISLTFPEDAG